MNKWGGFCFCFVMFAVFSWSSVSFAQYESNPLSRAVDETRYNFLSDGDRPFFSQTQTYTFGGSAAQSGNIGDDQVSIIFAAIAGGDKVAFSWKVSSERTYDGMAFIFSDESGNAVGSDAEITGNINWQRRELVAPANAVYAIWGYVKDGSLSSGADAGWVDEIQIGDAPEPPSENPNSAALPAIIMLLLDDEDA